MSMSTGTGPTLQLLGAGGAFSRRYGTTCSLLTARDGTRWLLDCGRQAPEQLHAAKISWHELAGQIVTHVHGDHVFGIEEFALTRYFETQGEVPSIASGGPRPRLIAHSSVCAELWEVLAPSLRYLPDTTTRSRRGSLSDYFDVVPTSHVELPRRHPWPASESFVSGALEICTREVVHVPGKPAFALEIGVGTDEHVAYWSGDATVDAAALVTIAPRATVLFHDCTFVEAKLQVHGAFSQLAALPEAVRTKMVLMHHEDDLEQHRGQIESLGFRIAEPGHRFDLSTGQRID